MNQTIMRYVFWTAFGVSEAMLLYLLATVYFSDSPWSDFGTILLLMPVSFLGVLGGLFETAKSENTRLLCLLVMFVPPPVLAVPTVDVMRQQARATTPTAVPVGGLAGALRRGDAAEVKARLPKAENLNRFYGQATRFLAGPEGEPLNRREIVEVMLEGGADVNYADGDEAPAWWAWIHRDGHRVENVAMVRMLVERGVNVKTQVRGEGPVAVAVRRECWQTAVLLLEAGAAWQGDSAKDVRTAVDRLAYGHQEMPEALGNLKVMIEEAR